MVDALRCERCSGRMRIVAAVVAGSEVKRILESLGLPSAAPKFHPARPPPQASLWPDEPTFESVAPGYDEFNT